MAHAIAPQNRSISRCLAAAPCRSKADPKAYPRMSWSGNWIAACV